MQLRLLERKIKSSKRSYLLGIEYTRNAFVSGAACIKHSTCTAVFFLQKLYSRFLFPIKKVISRGRWRISSEQRRNDRERQKETRICKKIGIQNDTLYNEGSREGIGQSIREYSEGIIKSITPVGIHEVWDIEVEDDHSYVAHGFINHNSSVNPNLQNISARGKFAKIFNIRSAFKAPKGKKLLVYDYSQLELRIMAAESLDPSMLDSFKNNEDIHSRTAVELFDLDCTVDKVKTKYNDKRSLAKNINFGLIYGMGPKKLAKQSEITIQDAYKYLNKYFERFFAVKEYIDEVKASLCVRGFVTNMFGRRRRLPEIMSDNKMLRARAERQGVNAKIQGGGADLCKCAMLRLRERFIDTDFRIIAQVHDEIIAECNEENAEKCGEIMKKIMETPIRAKLPVKFEVEGSICDTWSEGK